MKENTLVHRKVYEKHIIDLEESIKALIVKLRGINIPETKNLYSIGGDEYNYSSIINIDKYHIEQEIEKVKTVFKQMKSAKPKPAIKLDKKIDDPY